MMRRALLLSSAAAAAADLVCSSTVAGAFDGWCRAVCQHTPPFCPVAFCECHLPSPPAPSPPTPAPKPSSSPTPPTPRPLPHKKAIIGYWGSAADKPELAQLPEALRRGYNVICLAFGDTLAADGSFQIHTNLEGPIPTKESVSSAAGAARGSWQYLLSFGGQNAPGPAVSDEAAYADGFMAAYHAAKSRYGFDGIDIDIETGMATPLLRAYRDIFGRLHGEGEVISMAPQPLNIDPGEVSTFMDGAYNAYVPLVDTTMIDKVTYVAPQMYNNPMPLGDLERYVGSLQKGATVVWDGKQLALDIPSSKLVFGFPAASGAAPTGPSQSWEAAPATLVAHYRNSSVLMATGGMMTWSIGWDATTGWRWIDAVRGLWASEELVVV